MIEPVALEDFFIPFFDIDNSKKLDSIDRYIQQHLDFFVARGISTVYNVNALPLRYPVADLEDNRPHAELISLIAQRQHITRVTIE
jgi:hypothetical protein